MECKSAKVCRLHSIFYAENAKIKNQETFLTDFHQSDILKPVCIGKTNCKPWKESPMKLKTKYLAKRMFAMALAVALLWSDSSVVSLAQTVNGENGETSENPVVEISENTGEETSGGYSGNPAEEDSEEGKSGEENPDETGENEPGKENPDETGENEPGKENPDDTGEGKPGEEDPDNTGENDAEEENPEEETLEEEMIPLYDVAGSEGKLFNKTTTLGKAWLLLHGFPEPGTPICLRPDKDGVEGEPCECEFYASDDKEGNDKLEALIYMNTKQDAYFDDVYIGEGFYYNLTECELGRYVFVIYGVKNEDGSTTYYRTESMFMGYIEGDDEDAAVANGKILQYDIDYSAQISAGLDDEVKSVEIPKGIHIKADDLVISDRVRLEAWDAFFEGTIKTKSDMGGAVEIKGLIIANKGGTAVDASEAPVRLNDCTFILDNSNLLQVSAKSYGATELNGCRAEFTSGGSILKLTGDTASMGEFSLDNTDLEVTKISISGNEKVAMLAETAENVKWDVEGLSVRDKKTLAKLSSGTSDVNVINNIFYIEDENKTISNTNVLTLRSVYNKWISPVAADGNTFGYAGAGVTVLLTPGNTYEVLNVPVPEDDENYQFRPYAITGQYGFGQGSYSKLLPAGYKGYLVIDTTQKGGFPYGAQIAREWQLPADTKDFVVLQYHADKSVEVVCSVTDGEVAIKNNSILAELEDDGSGNYRTVVNTRVYGEDVREPIVLAIYSELPAAQAKFAVYEYELIDDGEGEDNKIKKEIRIPSDGKILTDGDKKVSLELNGGFGVNYYSGNAFTLDQDKCTLPEDSKITLQPDEKKMGAELIIPGGAYGTLTITPHYKSSANAAEAKLASYTLQITNIQNIEGTEVDSSAAGSKYYGTAVFDILSGEAKPFLGVSARNGEDARYNLKVTSSSISKEKVTVQYVLDLRYDGRPDGGEKTEESAWESFRNNPPCLTVGTTAGEWEIGLNAGNSEISCMDDERGVLYLFDLESENAVYKGARIINGKAFYPEGDSPRLVIPKEVKVTTKDGEKPYAVKVMAEGCLNNIYDNGVKANVPDIVMIPASVTDIRGKLITDNKYSNLRQIVVDDKNTKYCTYGSSGKFDDKNRDESQYCALYMKNGDKTELLEIASNYVGELAWRKDAEWTDAAYGLDFSGIYGFKCDEPEGEIGEYQSWDGLLVKITGKDSYVVVKAPGRRGGTDLLIPEGITGMEARALENVDITALVLPSTMKADGAWEVGAVTNAKSIYVYSKDTKVNPVKNLKDTLKGITFYGFVDESKNSALKTWAVNTVKSRGYKFTAMEESGAASDYTLKTLREAAKSFKGTEYYEVGIGEKLTETFDFDIASTVKNGYPGKADITVEVVKAYTGNAKYTAQEDEFEEEYDQYGRKSFRAVSPGVAEVVFKNRDGETVKTAYFAVRPDEFDIVRNEGEDHLEILLGKEGKIKAEAYVHVWEADDQETDDPEKEAVPEEALQEYEELGVLRSVVPEERAVAGGYDAWKIERAKNKFAYNVTPLLYKEEDGSIKGGSGSKFILELFGWRTSIWVETYAVAEDNKWLEPYENNDNPILGKGDSKEIAVIMAGEGQDTAPVDYYGEELPTLMFGDDGTTTYRGTLEYPQVACEVISGREFVDAAIINNEGNASVKLTAKKDGKALVRVFMPYSQEEKDMYLTVSVGKDLVRSFHLTLWDNNDNMKETLFSTVYADDEYREYHFDMNEKDEEGKPVWNNEIPVSDITNMTEKGPIQLPSDTLEWKISDPKVAELKYGDAKDKKKVTGIQLKGEGTVLVSATVKDTNKATINMLFTVWDGKPGFYNDSDSLDAYKKNDCAEYSLAVNQNVFVKSVELIEAKQGKTNVSGYFAEPVLDGKKIRISLKDGQPEPIPAKATTYTLTLKVTTAYKAGEEAEEETVEETEKPYEYPVKLTLGGPNPKATVSADNAMDLSIPSGRTSTLTVKLGDVTNSGMTLNLDEKDAVTKSFAEYFELKDNEELKENERIYTVSLKANNDKTAGDIAKLFNNKKIKLKVTSDAYKENCCVQEVEAVFKMSATVPVLKPAGNGKVTVNTGDATAYEGESCKASIAYTLTEGFKLGTEDGKIDMKIAAKQSAYADRFAFGEEDGQIVVTADPGLPKGAYTFTWTPQVLSNEADDIFTQGQTLKAQTITVTIAKSSAKIALSSAKLNLNRNYIYTEAQTWLQFDENQIRTLCGNAYWAGNDDGLYDIDKTQNSITLIKAPKTVTPDNSLVNVRMQDNWLAASVEDKGAPTGEYKYEIVPYVYVSTNEWIEGEGEEKGYEERRTISMPLAPLTFSVQVTDALPTASLTQATITMDNNDMSARAFTRWNIKGNYEYIDGDDPESIVLKSGNEDTQPEIWLEGNEIRVCPTENTLKGTYKYEITPKVVLDSFYSDDEEPVRNYAKLKPVTLTVNVTSTRPALKLAKSSLTVYSMYPGGENEEYEYGYYAPAEAGTDVDTSNGYAVGSIRMEPADAKTLAIDNDKTQKIELSIGYYTDENDSPNGVIRCFDAIPKTGTPAGTYKYKVYANLYDEDENGEPREGTALEPVMLTVVVKNNSPTLKLSAGSVTLPAGGERQGTAVITLLDPAECVRKVDEKAEYLGKGENGKWQLTAQESADAYARIETAKDGTVIITSLSGAAATANASGIAYSQKVFLKGSDIPYEAKYTLTIKFDDKTPTAVLSAKTITLSRNYDLWRQQEGNELKLSLNTGEKIEFCRIEDISAKDKEGVIRIEEVDRTENQQNQRFYMAYFNKPAKNVKPGDYSFRITPYATGSGFLAPVTVTVKVTDTLPTVSASTTKVTLNKLDTRGNTWQRIHFMPSSPYANVEYEVEVTNGPKTANLSEIDFFPEGLGYMHDETDLIIGSTDTEIPDGSYTVTVKPYTWKANGERADIKAIKITVTVNSPKVTAALRTPNMTVDVAAENSVDMRNSIVLTGTNAELVEKVYWKGWQLTKKPKGAGDWDIWIEDLYADDEHDGKEFSVCWGYDRQINITPGTYEFTLTPDGIRSCDGVDIPVPAAVKLTVTVKNTKPTVKYSKTSSKMNLFFTSEDRIYYTLSDSFWNLRDVDAVMTSWPKGVGEEKSALRIDFGGDRLNVSGTDKVPEGTYTFLLEARAEKNGMEVLLNEQKYTVTVKNELPTVKAAASKLTCNALYSGAYRLEDNPDDNFNQKQQTRLTLTQNYGFSHFEGVATKFAGNQNLKYEAAKIRWYYYDDGTIAANLPLGSVVAAGSYPFEVTPVIRSDDTDTQMTLKPVKLTVAVENKPLKASAKASGKIDLFNRDGSGITYNVTLSDKDLDAIREIHLVGPEKGDDESWKFELEQNPENPAECIVRANNWEDLSTKVKYSMQLEVNTRYGKVCYVPIQIQPAQSKLTLTTDVKSVTLFKQDYVIWPDDESVAPEFTGPVVEIKASINNTEAGEMKIWNPCEQEDPQEDSQEDPQEDPQKNSQKDLRTGNRDFCAWIVPPEDGKEEKGIKVQIAFASKMAEARYKAGSKVNLDVYVDIVNQPSETYGKTKVTIPVNIKN